MRLDCPDTTYDPQSIPREILPAARILSALDGNPLISSREFDIAQTLYLYKKLVGHLDSVRQAAQSFLKSEQQDLVLRFYREAIVARRLDQILPGLSSALNSTIASEPEDIEAGIRQIIKDVGP